MEQSKASKGTYLLRIEHVHDAGTPTEILLDFYILKKRYTPFASIRNGKRRRDYLLGYFWLTRGTESQGIE